MYDRRICPWWPNQPRVIVHGTTLNYVHPRLIWQTLSSGQQIQRATVSDTQSLNRSHITSKQRVMQLLPERVGRSLGGMEWVDQDGDEDGVQVSILRYLKHRRRYYSI